MSTDPTQPIQAPAPRPAAPQEPTAEPAPATKPVPKWQAPPPPPPPGQQRERRDQPPAAPAARPQEPPAARPQEPPTALDQGGPPTRYDQAPASGWDTMPPSQWDQTQARPGPQRPEQQRPEQQQWQQPQRRGEPQGDRPQPPQAAGQAGQWAQPPQPPAGQQPPVRRGPRKRRVRRSVMALFGVIVLVILLVIGDRVALAVTENDMASQFQQNGLPIKPSVTIEGFPFLTQLAGKDFNKVDISATNMPVPLPTGGNLSITSVKATINGLHISSYSSTASARVDHMTATVFVSFSALAAAGGIGDGTGLTFSKVNANTVKVNASLAGLVSDSEDVQFTVTGPQTISVKVLQGGGGVLGSVLGSFGSFSFNLPKGVPPTLKITDLSLNSQGVTISAAATNATFSQ